jgi:hypothetical protein
MRFAEPRRKGQSTLRRDERLLQKWLASAHFGRRTRNDPTHYCAAREIRRVIAVWRDGLIKCRQLVRQAFDSCPPRNKLFGRPRSGSQESPRVAKRFFLHKHCKVEKETQKDGRGFAGQRTG